MPNEHIVLAEYYRAVEVLTTGVKRLCIDNSHLHS
jgi:hypothetical protein